MMAGDRRLGDKPVRGRPPTSPHCGAARARVGAWRRVLSGTPECCYERESQTPFDHGTRRRCQPSETKEVHRWRCSWSGLPVWMSTSGR